MLLRAKCSRLLIILAFCFFENISSSPQRKLRQNVVGNTTISYSTVNQTISPTAKMGVRLTESYLPATMQALAYYIELLQYEPLHSTTVEPPFTISSTPPTVPNYSSSSPTRPSNQQQPVTWWSPSNTPTKPPLVISQSSIWSTQKPTTQWDPPTQRPTSQWNPPTQRPTSQWNPPTQRPTKPPVWWKPPTSQSDTSNVPSQSVSTTETTSSATPTTSTARPPHTTRRPSVSTTTPSWWHPETTPFHKPGNIAPEHMQKPSFNVGPSQLSSTSKPNTKPQIGDLSILSISNLPYFDYYVKPNSQSFTKKAEYEFLHQYPAELLQDIENETYDEPKGSDQEIVNEFRRVYDDFFSRVRIFAPITGKKRIPPTRPYVLFLIFYDLCKREAKRLALQEFTGYSHDMLTRLHETSSYSAERQLYTLMSELLAQNSITAMDFKTRINEIMIDLANPNSVTAKALHILPPLKFEF